MGTCWRQSAEAEWSQQQGCKCRQGAGSCSFLLIWITPGTLPALWLSDLRYGVCSLGLPLPLCPACSLPAAHREVRHSVVVRLEHPRVLEDVIPKCVKPIQRDQELSAGDPLLGKGTGTPSANDPGLLHWETLPPGPQKVGMVLGHRDKPGWHRS